MVSLSLAAAIAASLAVSPISGFTPSPHIPLARCTPSWSLAASGQGFGEKTVTKPKSNPASVVEAQGEDIAPQEEAPPSSQDSKGSTLLKQLRSRQAEERNAELQKIAQLRKTDEALLSDPGAAAIPERVAQRMGKRMLPFVGLPLFGSMASFVGFWYMATYRDMEFQPAIVATVSFVFLAMGLLGITYSVLSASWDDDREGSTFGAEEFSKNVESLREGLARSKENALLRDRMAGMTDDEIRRAMDSDK